MSQKFFYNDVKVKLFADDLKLSATVYYQIDHENLQGTLMLIESWADKWQLKFSVSKCKRLRIGYSSSDWHQYSIRSNSLDTVPERIHIRSVVARAHQLAVKYDFTMFSYSRC